MTTVDTVAQAIKEKKALEFAYHGFDRVVVPYACGLTPTNEIKMIGFQIGGGSNSGVTEKTPFLHCGRHRRRRLLRRSLSRSH